MKNSISTAQRHILIIPVLLMLACGIFLPGRLFTAGASSDPQLTAPAQCDASFAAATNFAVGAYPYSIAVADFNGDGKLDLANSNFSSASVSILLGTGTGTFGAATNFAVGSGPLAVAVGDFNGDSKLDLAVSNGGFPAVISILLGTGTGSFGPPTNFAAGSGVWSIAVGDFNGDGKLDLAAPDNGSFNVAILLGTGTGSFGAATNFSAGAINPFFVAVGDFNNDGKSDLAVTVISSSSVRILMGNGTGSFSAATAVALPGFSRGLALADLNGDGMLDLAVAISNGASVSVLLGTGTGSFSAATTFPIGLSPWSVAVGDVNGDGKLDLAVANAESSNLSVLLGTGTGGFGAATTFIAGSSPESIVMRDFNADLKLDLAVGNTNSNTISILLNNGTACATPTPTPTPQLVTISGQVRDPNSQGVPNVKIVFEQQLNNGGTTVTNSLPTDANGNYSKTINATTIAQGGVFHAQPLDDGYMTTDGQVFYTFNLGTATGNITGKDFVPAAATPTPTPTPTPTSTPTPTPTPTPNPNCTQPFYTLIHWYKGEDNYQDIVSHTNGAITSPSAVGFAAGKVGRAFSFDGSGSYIVSQTNILSNLPLTIEAWVKPALRNDGSDFPVNAVSNHHSGNFGPGFGLNVFTGGSQLKVEYRDGTHVVPGVSFDADQWYHIAVTYRIGEVRTYVNGVQVDEFDFTQGSFDGFFPLLIGRHETGEADGTRNSFRGLIDEVSIYPSRLTIDPIRDIFEAGSAGKCVPPPAPPNDHIQNAQVLVGSSNTVFGSNAGATRQLGNFRSDLGLPDEPQLVTAKPGGRSVWYKWTAPANGELALDTWQSGFDTLLGVYTEFHFPFPIPFTLFVPVASNDDTDSHNIDSYVRFSVEKNMTYFIAVDGYKGKTGNINLRYAFYETKPAPPAAIVTGMSPTVACTNDSDPTGFCSSNFDLGGFFVVRLTGKNFTTDSEIVVNRQSLSGFDRTGHAVNGYTTFISSGAIEAHIPPSPPLNFATADKLEVVRKVASPTTSTSKLQLGPLGDLLPGSYIVASNFALLDVIQLRNTVVPVGGQTTVCGNTPYNKPDEETCITYDNNSSQPLTITTTYFLATIQCSTTSANYAEEIQCLNNTLGLVGSNAFAINPALNDFLPTAITVKTRIAIPPDQLLTGDTRRRVELMVQGGQVISRDGAGIVAAGAGNIIAGGAGNIIAGGAGNIIAGGAGNIVSTDGATFNIGLGGNVASSTNVLAMGARSGGSRRIAQINSVADLSTQGSTGWFIAHGSGGSTPVLKTTDDPLTGEAITTAEITLDNTSNPRVSDLRGLAFAFAVAPPIIQLDSTNITVDEGAGGVDVKIVRTGDTSGPAVIDYATSDGTAVEAKNYTSAFGSLIFAPGETEKTIRVLIIDDAHGTEDEGTQNNFRLTIGNQVGAAVMMPNVATITINNNDLTTSTVNPIGDAQFFVRQHYLDFFSREPDASGLSFWANEITSCGTDAHCLEVKRMNVSAAFFLSIEFQQTGFLVTRLHAATFGGELPTNTRMRDFLAETQSIGRGVVVGQTGWEELLEKNRKAFLDAWVTRPEFFALYAAKTNEELVNGLFANAGVGASEETALRTQMIDGLNAGTETRATALRKIVESHAFTDKTYNPSFVLMQYYGYLRRNPDDAPDNNLGGYHFWLNKLNQFGGDFRTAEMVKSFIVSGEFRGRFGKN